MDFEHNWDCVEHDDYKPDKDLDDERIDTVDKTIDDLEYNR